jgi:hypothetical protein
VLETQGGRTVLAQECGVVSLPGSGVLSGHCDACNLAQWIGDRTKRHTESRPALAEDEDVVVLRLPDPIGLVVIPRHHVSGLAELPPQQRARVLAALRRISVSIGDEHHGSAPTVVVTTDPPASDGHICFQIGPGTANEGFDT